MMTSAFQGLQEAKIFEKGTPLTPNMGPGGYIDATYDLRVSKCILKKTRKSGDAFICEFEVLASDNSAHPVGSKRSWYQSMKDLDVAFPSIKTFVLAVSGISLDDKSAVAAANATIVADMDEACSERNALAGAVVRCVVHNKITKSVDGKPGHDFSHYTFTPLEV